MPESHQFTHSARSRRSSIVVGSYRSSFFDPQDNLLHRTERRPSSSSVLVTGFVDPDLLNEEVSLLRDNNINLPASVEHHGAFYGAVREDDAAATDVADAWETSVAAHKVVTSTRREFYVLATSAFPLIVTFLLQNSLTMASVFSVGHIGSQELSGVTLASLTASITCIAAIQGLATCLDTLCPEAYGSGNLRLVGVYFQRCTALILTAYVPVALLWWIYAERALVYIVPETEVAILSARYLRVISLGMPGYIFFETGKRFLQAQGIFNASTSVLFVVAPLNILLNYTLVWSPAFGIGYIGAPVAVAISYWAMAIGLLVFTVTTKSAINPLKCWGGFSLDECFRKWSVLFGLALPGVVMIEAEFLAFECLTLMASHLGSANLAAQSIIATLTSLGYQIPFSVSVASATRTANFIGSGMPQSAAKTVSVSILFGVAISIANVALFYFGRGFIPHLFTNDSEVAQIVKDLLPLIAVLEFFDALATVSGGCLRGEGMQKIGSWLNLAGYYLIGIPLVVLFTFRWGWGLYGLWVGILIGLALIGSLLVWFAVTANMNELVARARSRNENSV
ncbi:hypothetical protein BABINDRAFT_33867 [Babjeviella inositovora NRRL Y-12698]|uniref:MATE efflux family protein n=1 Tax=Babjeviella inositovora NRRL Y-12698 TaxID=984486 RepID=A0A1E3QUH5_9ASCO|nr:uncharacterized protein BABINDRAFT_33867 [Babjeviella inositovora NRRL Y-12698]ODQ81328.1 hypothetical protein BABINDRAFT_33867 [Babjeviella inositovora NRRL Y-12698]